MLYTVVVASAILAAQWVKPVSGADRPDAVDAPEHSALSKCGSDIIIEILSFISEGRDYLSVSETCRLMNECSREVTAMLRATVPRKNLSDAMELFSQQNRRVLMNVDDTSISIRGYPLSLPNPFIGQCKVLKKMQCKSLFDHSARHGCLPPMNDWVIGQCGSYNPSFLLNIRNGLSIALPKCNGAGFISPSRIVVQNSEKCTLFELYKFDGKANIEKMTELDIADEISFFSLNTDWKAHRKCAISDDDKKCPCMVIASPRVGYDRLRFHQIDLSNKVMTKKEFPFPNGIKSSNSHSMTSISPDGSTIVLVTFMCQGNKNQIVIIDAIKGEIKRAFLTNIKTEITLEWIDRYPRYYISISPDNTWMTVNEYLINLDHGETTRMMDFNPQDSVFWLNDQIFIRNSGAWDYHVRSVLSCHSNIDSSESDCPGSMVKLERLLVQGQQIAQHCWWFRNSHELLVTEIAKRQ